MTHARSIAVRLALLAGVAACAPGPEAPPPLAAPAPVAEHHHELHLPPVGPAVKVTLDGKSVDVPLAGLPHEGSTAPLTTLWRAAFPGDDPAPLHFDLTGSDGFHPASRPACGRLLTSAEVALARIDVTTHDVSYDSTLQLPGCFRVHAVVTMDGSR